MGIIETRGLTGYERHTASPLARQPNYTACFAVCLVPPSGNQSRRRAHQIWSPQATKTIQTTARQASVFLSNHQTRCLSSLPHHPRKSPPLVPTPPLRRASCVPQTSDSLLDKPFDPAPPVTESTKLVPKKDNAPPTRSTHGRRKRHSDHQDVRYGPVKS